MIILHVISNMDPQQGGVCQAVRTTIAGLAGKGMQNEVVSQDAPDAPWGQSDPFPVHAVGPARGPWAYSAALTPWLLANLARFDAVILHGLWLYNGYALRKAVRQLRARQPSSAVAPRLYVMPHGMLDPYFQQAAGRRLKAWRNKLYWHLIERFVVNEATGVLFTCETERLLARQPFAPYHPRQELVVGLGVEEPPRCQPAMQEAFLAKCPAARNRPYLLFLSRIHDKKGVELLLQAYTSLCDQISEADVAAPLLVLAGPGLETDYGQRMQALAAALPTAAVSFSGMLTGEAKWGAFYGCEAFVLPSHQENFGIAVVEALACGKPVLISNQVNIWREIEAAGGGIVADDTLAGTQHLLESWHCLTNAQKQAMRTGALAAYQQHFAVGPAAANMAQAISA